MRRFQGFTLIELMITVAIVAILASIAVPSYTAYIQRARITEAVSGLASMAVNMERYFQDNRNYTNACGAAGSSIAPLPPATKSFTFTCPTHDTTTFTVTATGTASMANFKYSINESNTKTTDSVPTGWNVPNPNTCWALKADGSC